MTDISSNWQVSLGQRGLLSPDKLYIGYTEHGGPLAIMSGEQVPCHYHVVDPRTGEVLKEGIRAFADEWIPDDGGGPRVYICCEA